MIIGRGKPKYSDTNLSASTPIRHKSRKDFPGMNPALREEKPVTNLNDTMAHIK
jgi:hypothetical protein